MAAKIAILAIFAISLSVVSCFPHREMLDCKGKPDGVYPDPDDNRGYYVCIDHLPYVHLDCDEGEHFDNSFKTCVKDVPTGDEEEEKPQNYASDPEGDIKQLKEELPKLVEDEGFPGWPGDDMSKNKYKVFNIQVTENIFPRSVVIIGKANREQKNK